MRIVIEQPIYVPNLDKNDYWRLYHDFTVHAIDDHISPQKIDLDECDMEQVLDIIWEGSDGGITICLNRYDTGRYQLEYKE